MLLKKNMMYAIVILVAVLLIVVVILSRRNNAINNQHQQKIKAMSEKINCLANEERRLSDKITIIKSMRWLQNQNLKNLTLQIFAMQKSLFDKLSNKI